MTGAGEQIEFNCADAIRKSPHYGGEIQGGAIRLCKVSTLADWWQKIPRRHV